MKSEEVKEIKQTRAAKQLGDFGEGLVTYALIRKGYEIAVVDHVGADLIAEKNGDRFAISVKTRMFREGSPESRVFPVDEKHLTQLEYFAKQFGVGMKLLYALLIILVDEKEVHLLILPVADLKKHLPQSDHGYSVRFSKSKRDDFIKDLKSFGDYSFWKEEEFGEKKFFSPIVVPDITQQDSGVEISTLGSTPLGCKETTGSAAPVEAASNGH